MSASKPRKASQAALIASGDVTASRVGARPQQRRCPDCGRPCLVAVPFLLWGATWVDSGPVSSRGELDALMAGLRSWTVTPRGVEHRSVESIQVCAASDAGDVHATHVCGRSWDSLPVPDRVVSASLAGTDPPY